MTRDSRSPAYPDGIILIVAMDTFYSIAVSIVEIMDYRKYKSHSLCRRTGICAEPQGRHAFCVRKRYGEFQNTHRMDRCGSMCNRAVIVAAVAAVCEFVFKHNKK